MSKVRRGEILHQSGARESRSSAGIVYITRYRSCVSGFFIAYFCPMKRSILLYSVAMAALLVLLRAIDYKYLLFDISTELYITIIALFFTILGLWIGRKVTSRSRSQPVLATTTNRVPTSDLGISPRETEVLRLIAAGHSNQEIADTLFLSLNTVKKHTSTLFKKLEAERRTQAIEKARRMGLID